MVRTRGTRPSFDLVQRFQHLGIPVLGRARIASSGWRSTWSVAVMHRCRPRGPSAAVLAQQLVGVVMLATWR